MIRSLVELVTGYPGLMAFCAVSGLLIPLPEDIPLVYAGVRVRDGGFAWLPTMAAAIVGVGVRDLLMYALGRVLGDRLLTSTFATRWIGSDRIERAEAVVRERGAAAVLVGRFLVGLRAPVFAVAGASRVPLRKFLVYNSIGLLITVPGVISLGFLFGDGIIDMVLFFAARLREVVVLLLVGVALYSWRRFR